MTMSALQVIISDDEEPVLVSTAAELDSVLDRVAAQASPEAPPLIALDLPERQRSMMVGIRGAVGVLNFVEPGLGGYASKGLTSGVSTPPYYYCDQWTGITEDAEIPIEQVRAAAREFLATGERPSGITWQ